MNLDLNEEQILLQDSVARFVKDRYSIEQRARVVRTPTGFSREHWQAMAQLGWLALPFSVADGGTGGSAVEIMVLMEQFGKGLVVEPFLASVILGGGALRRGATPAIKREWLRGVINGTRQLAFAHVEAQTRFDVRYVSVTAEVHGDDFILNGHKSFVLNLASADAIVVSARTGGQLNDASGMTFFLVDARSEGVTVEAYPTVDGLQAGDLHLNNVRVSREHMVGKHDRGFDILNPVANDAILALGAEAVGVMEVLYQDTVQYTQQRVQFDKALADFQVLQHRMVDMFVEYELAKSMLYRATVHAAQNSEDAQRSIHALKYLVGRAGAFVGESAVQLHGGMGMTEELRVGHFFKRLLVIDMQLGNSEYHLRKFASMPASATFQTRIY